jgi:hypothetical protein
LEILHLFYTTLAAMAAENKPICFTFNWWAKLRHKQKRAFKTKAVSNNCFFMQMAYVFADIAIAARYL